MEQQARNVTMNIPILGVAAIVFLQECKIVFHVALSITAGFHKVAWRYNALHSAFIGGPYDLSSSFCCSAADRAAASVVASAQQFIVASTIAAAEGTYVVSGDFNGDGHSDVALLGFHAFTQKTLLTILLGTEDDSFTQVQQVTLTNGLTGLATADFNRYGILDLAVGEGSGAAIYLGAGDDTFTAGDQYPVTNFVHGITAGDLNGDGVPDLIVAEDAGAVSVLLARGDGTFSQAVDYNLGKESTHRTQFTTQVHALFFMRVAGKLGYWVNAAGGYEFRMRSGRPRFLEQRSGRRRRGPRCSHPESLPQNLRCPPASSTCRSEDPAAL